MDEVTGGGGQMLEGIGVTMGNRWAAGGQQRTSIENCEDAKNKQSKIVFCTTH
jgi:hypothetical protein